MVEIVLVGIAALVAILIAILYIAGNCKKQAASVYRIMDSIVDALFIIDAHGVISYLNPAAEAIFGYPRAELLGRNIGVLMPESDSSRHDEYIRHYLETGEKRIIGVGREVMARRKNGDIFPIHLAVNQAELCNKLVFIGIVQDITERKAAENKLQKSEMMLSASQKIGHLGHWDWDIVTNDLYWSDEIYRIFGLAPQEFGATYPAFLATIHPDDRDMVVRAVNDAVAGISDYSIEHRIILPGGMIKTVHEQGELTRDPGGKPLRMLGVVQDITDRTIAGEKLRQSEEKYRNLFEHNADAIFVADTQTGMIIDANKKAQELTGRDISEIRTLHQAQLHPPEDVGDVVAKFKNAVEGTASGIVEANALHKDGRAIPIEITTAFYADENGKQKIIGVFRDVSARKEAEDKVRHSEEMLKEAQKMANIGNFEITYDDKNNPVSVHWSDQLYSMFGYMPGEIPLSFGTISTMIYPDDIGNLAQLYRNTMAGNKPYRTEFRIMQKNGAIRTVYAKAKTFYDSKGRLVKFIGTLQDITKRKEYEKALEDIKDAALEASRAKSEFLANMSHEIRTPMNTTIGAAELLRETELTDEQLEYVEMFQRSGEHLLSLINDILDLSKIEAGHLELEQADFMTAGIIERVKGTFSLKAKEKGVALLCSADGDLPPVLNGDAHRLNQVLLNLVGNALKFTQEGEVAVDLKLVKKDDPMGSVTILVEVTDTGIGIPADRIDRLFQNFSQVDSSTTRKYGGTGLGLAISRRLVEMMRGSIWAESPPPGEENRKGSKFSFTAQLGIGRDTDQDTEAAPVAEQRKTGNGNNLVNILLAEDTHDCRELIRFYLKNIPANLVTADNGREALGKLKENRYDIVFMDIQMPGLDGYTVTKLYREWETAHNLPRIPIIGLSANAFRDAADKALEAGCTDYIAKPAGRARILDILRKYT